MKISDIALTRGFRAKENHSSRVGLQLRIRFVELHTPFCVIFTKNCMRAYAFRPCTIGSTALETKCLSGERKRVQFVQVVPSSSRHTNSGSPML